MLWKLYYLSQDKLDLFNQIKNISKIYIEQKIFEHISKSVLNKAIEQKRLLVRFSDSNLVAFLIWKEYKSSIYISSICVEDKQRGFGIGKQFISFMKCVAKDKNKNLKLSVAKINKDAIGFYIKEGFRFINKEKEDRYRSIATYEMICEII